MAAKKRFKYAKWWLLGGMAVATVGCLLVLWTAAGLATSGRAEELTPAITFEREGYRLCQYPPHTLACVEVIGERYTRALFRGFEWLNRYISGGNDQRKRIPMTAPVLQYVLPSGNGFVIAFVLPEELNRAGTEPKPSDQRVQLDRKPATWMAVRPFSGYATSEYAAEQIAILKDLLEKDGFTVSGYPAVAQFDPPWTPPFMRYNEVWWELNPKIVEQLKPEEQETVRKAGGTAETGDYPPAGPVGGDRARQ